MTRIGWIVAAAAALALPLLVPKPFYLQIVATGYITAIAVYGLNILLGYTGLLNLGHAAFFAIGAYTVALLETRAGVPFLAAIAAAVFLSVAAGLLVGVISLRTRGHYFAIFTAAVGVIISTIILNAKDLTGGNVGIVAIPGPAPIAGISFEGPAAKYYLILAFLSVTIVLCSLVRRSLFGRTLVAIAMNEDLARATGVDVFRTKLVAFLLSVAFAGLAGGLFAPYIGFLDASVGGLDVTFDQLLYLVVGGLATTAGPLAGTLILVILSQLLQSFEQYRFLIYGPMLVLLIIFFPRGLAGAVTALRARLAAAA